MLAVLCMMLIANLQYGWTLFVQPIWRTHGWSIAEIQWAFSPGDVRAEVAALAAGRAGAWGAARQNGPALSRVRPGPARRVRTG